MSEIIENINQTTDMLIMDNDLRGRFDAIDVTSRLLDENKPDGVFYTTSPAYPLYDICETIETEINIKIDGVKNFVTVSTPSFFWSIWVKNIKYVMILECESDYTVKYPIQCFMVTQFSHNTKSSSGASLEKENVLMLLDHILIAL